jgi:MOSC domain-containing protein YiiM
MPNVTAVFRSATHTMRKTLEPSIRLLAGLGVEGDAHAGVTVKHRSRVAADPTQPNLRQVHLIHSELHEQLQARGFRVRAGEMGENITTQGVNLLALPVGTRLRIGPKVILEITGLRNPCLQLDGLEPGLMQACLDRDEDDQLIRKAGIMGIVIVGGVVQAGDEIQVELPPKPHRALERV